MTFHFLNNVLLLDLALKAAKGVFKGFTLLKFYFGQTKYTSQPDLEFSCAALDCPNPDHHSDRAVRKFLHFAQEVLLS